MDIVILCRSTKLSIITAEIEGLLVNFAATVTEASNC